MGAEHSICVRIREDLYKTIGLTTGKCTSYCSKWEGARFIVNTFSFEFLLSFADTCDFWVRVNDRRYAVIVELHGLAVNALRDHDALFRAFVRKHGTANNVAYRPNTRRFGSAVIVYENKATFISGHTRVGSK